MKALAFGLSLLAFGLSLLAFGLLPFGLWLRSLAVLWLCGFGRAVFWASVVFESLNSGNVFWVCFLRSEILDLRSQTRDVSKHKSNPKHRATKHEIQSTKYKALSTSYKTKTQRSKPLLIPISNSAARQIVGRHLNAYSIANQNSDPIFSHLAGNSCQHNVFAIIEPDFEKGVGLFVNDYAFRWNEVFCCQIVWSPSLLFGLWSVP